MMTTYTTEDRIVMSNELGIRNMIRSEVDALVAWDEREGWNPGLHDAEVFWATDPDAFIAADLLDVPRPRCQTMDCPLAVCSIKESTV